MKTEDKNIEKFANARTWTIEATSNDGLKVTKDKIYFKDAEYTISTTRKYKESFDSALEIYDNLFKS